MSKYYKPSLYILSTLGGALTFLILLTFNDWPVALLFAAIIPITIAVMQSVAMMIPYTIFAKFGLSVNLIFFSIDFSFP